MARIKGFVVTLLWRTDGWRKLLYRHRSAEAREKEIELLSNLHKNVTVEFPEIFFLQFGGVCGLPEKVMAAFY